MVSWKEDRSKFPEKNPDGTNIIDLKSPKISQNMAGTSTSRRYQKHVSWTHPSRAINYGKPKTQGWLTPPGGFKKFEGKNRPLPSRGFYPSLPTKFLFP